MTGVLVATALATMPLSYGADVYRCERPDGTLEFSDTKCSSSEADRSEVRVVPNEASDQAKVRKQNARERRRWKEVKKMYLDRRERIKQKMENINLGLDQTLSDLMENKARYNFLQEELERLDIAWQNMLDPDGAEDRAYERRIQELEDRIRELESDQGGTTQIRINNQYHTCQQVGTTINCD